MLDMFENYLPTVFRAKDPKTLRREHQLSAWQMKFAAALLVCCILTEPKESYAESSLILEKQTEFFKEYAIKLIYNDPSLADTYSGGSSFQLPGKTFYDLIQVAEGIDNLQLFLGMFPSFMFQKINDKKNSKIENLMLILCKNLKDSEELKICASKFFGMRVDLDCLTDKKYTRYIILGHEFFHWLYDNDVDAAQSWIALNANGIESYIHYSAIEAGQEAKENNLDLGQYVPGFADLYGQMGGVSEDMASVAGRLFSGQSDIESFINNCKTDKVLRNKLEMMTGCKFDPLRGKFSRMYSQKEYGKKFKVPGYKFFAKWSRDEAGKTLMDEQYWNALIQQKKIFFEKSDNNYVLRINN